MCYHKGRERRGGMGSPGSAPSHPGQSSTRLEGAPSRGWAVCAGHVGLCGLPLRPRLESRRHAGGEFRHGYAGHHLGCGRRTGGTPARVLRGHRRDVYGVAWSPEGSRLASSGWDSTIRLWDPTLGCCLQIMGDSDSADTLLFGLAWSPDGKLLACGTYQRGVQVWDVTARCRRWVGEEHATWIRRVARSPDGTRVVGGGDDGHVSVWGAADGTQLLRLVGHQAAV